MGQNFLLLVQSNGSLRRSPLLLHRKLPVISAGIVFFSLLSLTFVGCGKKKGSQSAESAKFYLPWQGPSGGEYQLQDVEIKTLSQPEKLQGTAANLHVAAKYEPGQGFEGKKPKFQFSKSGSTFIAKDTLSLQSAVVYAHVEKLQEIDRLIGVDQKVKSPLQVGIDGMWEMKSGKHGVNNAFYDGRTNSLIVVPYEADNLPMTLNAGVIAHEYSHAIFSALVRRPLVEARGSQAFLIGGHGEDFLKQAKANSKGHEISTTDFNIQFVLRSADEGLADYWAWVYTGDDSFMGRSLAEHADRRRLDVEPKRLKSLKVWVKSGDKASAEEKSMISHAYRQGTEYARFFRSLSIRAGYSETREQRIEMAKRLVPALHEFMKEVGRGFDGFLSPNLILRTYLNVNKDLAAEHCQFFQKVISEDEVESLSCGGGKK